MNAQLDQPLTAYNEFRAQLAELAKRNSQAVFDYETPSGNKEARSHIFKLRQTKAAVDKVRKSEKEASLEYGRRVDSQAKEIINEIELMIEVHQKPLDEIEQREKNRVENLQRDIVEIEGGGLRSIQEWMSLPLDCIKDRLSEIENEPMTEERWQEFLPMALQKQHDAVKLIREAIGKREKYDAEQAELAELRRKQLEADQKARDEKIAQEAAERARKEAEIKANREHQAAEAKANAEKAAADEKLRREREAEQRKLLEEQLRAEKAEREKVEAEQRAKDAERKAKENAEREAKEKAQREAAELAKREADKKHRAQINNAALDALIAGGIPKAHARTAIELIASKVIPNVTIQY